MKNNEEEDFKFLLDRCSKAGAVSFSEDRDTGLSSNSIVMIAYDLIDLDKQILPGDWSDLQACENMYKKLPYHRKTGIIKKAMARAREYKK